MKEILQNIKRVRKEKGFSHWRISYLLGISRGAYSMCEAGATTLTVERLDKISKILEVPVTELWNTEAKNG